MLFVGLTVDHIFIPDNYTRYWKKEIQRMQCSRSLLNILLTVLSAEIWENSSIKTDKKHKTF